MEDRTNKEAAGIVVFLLEELGDARMRCAQLKKLVAEAIDLVEKSPKRDHFFEVAAHLIHGIPDNLLRLEKALDAAAMSGARMDYEEIKDSLKPEKAEALEEVLEDVRLKHLQRRSTGEPMNAKSAAEEIRRIADHADATGSVPVNDLLVLVAALEKGVKQASDETVSSKLRKVADDMANGKNPSRVALAKSLRSLLADAVQPTASQKATALMQQAGSREDVMKGFKEANPELTDAQLKDIADQWEKNKNVVKDKQAMGILKGAAAEVDRTLGKMRRTLTLDGIAPLRGLIAKLESDPIFTLKAGVPTQDVTTAGVLHSIYKNLHEVMPLIASVAEATPKTAVEEKAAAKDKPKLDKAKVQKWMKLHVKDYVDGKTDEANCTKMAEECCQELGLHEGDDIPEEMFDIALDVADKAGHGVKTASKPEAPKDPGFITGVSSNTFARAV